MLFLPASRLIAVDTSDLDRGAALQQHPLTPHRQGPQQPPREPLHPDVSPRLPDGDSQILRLYVFSPSGLQDYSSATLRCKI